MPEELEELGKLNLKTAPPFFGRGEFGFLVYILKTKGQELFWKASF